MRGTIPSFLFLALFLSVVVACSGDDTAEGESGQDIVAGAETVRTGPGSDTVGGDGTTDAAGGRPDSVRDATSEGRPDVVRDATPEGDGAVGEDSAGATVGSPPSIEVSYVPSRIPGCWDSCNVQSLRFEVTDADGIEDLAGGEVLVVPGGAVVAELDGGTERHEVGLTWRRLHEAESIDFEGAEQARTLRIVYRDRAGNTTSADVEVTLYCPDGGPACDGRCTEGDCFPMVRPCSGGQNCEYHLYPGGNGGAWRCVASGMAGLGGLCGPDVPCRSGFACYRRDAVGCEGAAGSDGCCTPRCRPGADDCPENMTCRALSSDRPCDERLGFCIF